MDMITYALLMKKINAGGGGGSLQIHVCTTDEYDHTTGVPTVASPASDTLYLVPASDATTGNLFDEWVYATAAWEKVGSTSINVPVQDVQVNGTSILNNGVANIVKATDAQIKAGTEAGKMLVPSIQDASAFFGLAKAAGDTSQSQSDNTVGTYTESAKSAIAQMLGGSVAVSGATPTIAAKAGVRYVCGEASTLAITVPASGIIDVVFESGSTATVLTITPPTGVTAVKWANGFDPTSLDANTTYEINIMDGEYGVAVAWT